MISPAGVWDGAPRVLLVGDQEIPLLELSVPGFPVGDDMLMLCSP